MALGRPIVLTGCVLGASGFQESAGPRSLGPIETENVRLGQGFFASWWGRFSVETPPPNSPVFLLD